MGSVLVIATSLYFKRVSLVVLARINILNEVMQYAHLHQDFVESKWGSRVKRAEVA